MAETLNVLLAHLSSRFSLETLGMSAFFLSVGASGQLDRNKRKIMVRKWFSSGGAVKMALKSAPCHRGSFPPHGLGSALGGLGLQPPACPRLRPRGSPAPLPRPRCPGAGRSGSLCRACCKQRKNCSLLSAITDPFEAAATITAASGQVSFHNKSQTTRWQPRVG